jgi:aspartate/methionine/tyrosine aminotransferase
MVDEFRARRNLIVQLLNSIPGFTCKLPSGAFYVFPNVTQACQQYGFPDAKALQHYLLHTGHVATLPRTSFGAKNIGETEEYLRFSYATSRDTISQGIQLIKNVLNTRGSS